MKRGSVWSRGMGFVLLTGLLVGAPATAVTYGHLEFTQASVDDCADMFGTCEWKLTCTLAGGQPTEIFAAAGAVAQDIEVEKSFELKSFPAKVDCTLQEDDGWFGESWVEAGKASIDLPGGGDFLFNLKGDQGTVVLKAAVDSFEMPDGAAVPAGEPAKAAKPAKPGKARQFIGGYLKDAKGHAVVLGLPWDAFKARIDQFAAQGVLLSSMQNWEEGGKRLWGGIFRSAKGKQELVTDLEFEPFLARFKPLFDQNMRIQDMEIYAKGNKFYFTGVYQEGTDEGNTFWLDELTPFVAKWNSLSGGQLRLVDLNVYQASGKWRYAGVFRGGSGPYGLRYGLTWDDLQTFWKAKEAEGRTGITDLVTHNDKGKQIWDIATGAGQGQMTPLLEGAALAQDWNDRVAKGFRLTTVATVP